MPIKYKRMIKLTFDEGGGHTATFDFEDERPTSKFKKYPKWREIETEITKHKNRLKIK